MIKHLRRPQTDRFQWVHAQHSHTASHRTTLVYVLKSPLALQPLRISRYGFLGSTGLKIALIWYQKIGTSSWKIFCKKVFRILFIGLRPGLGWNVIEWLVLNWFQPNSYCFIREKLSLKWILFYPNWSIRTF